MGVIITLLWILFILSALLLCAIILLQEGKGGGLAEAFGGVGAEAFGVKAGGVTRVTAILAAVFIGSAILVATLDKPTALRTSEPEVPAFPGGTGEPGDPPPDQPGGGGDAGGDPGDAAEPGPDDNK